MRYTKTEEQYLARYKPSPIHACYNRRYLGVVSGLVPGHSLDEADISSVSTINRAGNRRYGDPHLPCVTYTGRQEEKENASSFASWREGSVKLFRCWYRLFPCIRDVVLLGLP